MLLGFYFSPRIESSEVFSFVFPLPFVICLLGWLAVIHDDHHTYYYYNDCSACFVLLFLLLFIFHHDALPSLWVWMWLWMWIMAKKNGERNGGGSDGISWLVGGLFCFMIEDTITYRDTNINADVAETLFQVDE